MTFLVLVQTINLKSLKLLYDFTIPTILMLPDFVMETQQESTVMLVIL